jgi:pyridoxine/pyridoxamine 5'-phosphate oxidase
LIRFRAQSDPLGTLAAYLQGIAEEADRRGYHYNHGLIGREGSTAKIPVTRRQLLHEWEHLKRKLLQRDPARYAQIQAISEPEPHPLFTVVPGEVETWEGRHPRRKTGVDEGMRQQGDEE